MRTTIDKAGRLLIAAGSGKQIDVEQVRPSAMPPGADIRLVDTSAAVPLVAQGHKDHEAVFEAVGSLRLWLSGHAAIEIF